MDFCFRGSLSGSRTHSVKTGPRRVGVRRVRRFDDVKLRRCLGSPLNGMSLGRKGRIEQPFVAQALYVRSSPSFWSFWAQVGGKRTMCHSGNHWPTTKCPVLMSQNSTPKKPLNLHARNLPPVAGAEKRPKMERKGHGHLEVQLAASCHWSLSRKPCPAELGHHHVGEPL